MLVGVLVQLIFHLRAHSMELWRLVEELQNMKASIIISKLHSITTDYIKTILNIVGWEWWKNKGNIWNDVSNVCKCSAYV